MYKFGKTSKKNLDTLCLPLQHILNMAIRTYDFSILEGHRDKEKQDRYFKEGKSKLKFPDSKHNSLPSHAVDIAPYPIDWNDRERFVYLAGIIKGIGHALGYNIRWGGDFNMNNDLKDQSFNDLPHFEIREK